MRTPVYTTDSSREELAPEQRPEIRDRLLKYAVDVQPSESLKKHPWLCFQALAIKRYGPAAGILCRELLFWDGKGWDPEGFTHLTKEEGEERMGLSPKSQDGGRKRLQDAGVLQVERRPRLDADGSLWKGRPSPVLHHRLDLPALFEQFTGESLDHDFKHADRDARTRGSGCSNTPNGDALYTEVTAEVTTKDTPSGAAQSTATAEEETVEGKREGRCRRESGVLVAELAGELEDADVPYSRAWRGRHGRGFAEALRKDVEVKVLRKATERIVEVWSGGAGDHRKLTVDQALGDVVNGRAPRHIREAAKPPASKQDGAARRREGYEWLFEDGREKTA